MKYNGFKGGDYLPAENVNSIDPNNYVADYGGYLTGGTNIASFSEWNDIYNNGNDGKIKISIDGTIYDNIGIDLSTLTAEETNASNIVDDNQFEPVYGNNHWGQSFTPTKSGYFTKLSLKCYANSGASNKDVYFKLYNADSNDKPTGSALESITVSLDTFKGLEFAVHEITFAGTTHIVADQKYVIMVSCPSASTDDQGFDFIRKYTNSYAGGMEVLSADGGSTYSTNSSHDLYFITKIKVGNITDQGQIASLLQSAIRTATGSTETAVFSNDHFIISSATTGNASKVLKLTAPSTGTDISEDLDLGTGATETWGFGNVDQLVRLDADGLVPKAIIPVDLQVVGGSTSRQTGATYLGQNTSYTKSSEITYHDINGVVRVYQQISASGSGYTCSSKLYKNGVDLNLDHSTTTNQTFTDDIALQAGDLIELYTKTSNASGYNQVVSFYFAYDKTIKYITS